MNPMLGRVSVELEQGVEVVGDLGDRFGVLGAVVDLERLDRHLRLVDILGVVDVLDRRQRCRVRRFRQCGKDIGLLVKPAALLTGRGEHFAHGFPQAQCSVADGQHGGGHPAAFAVAQQISPRLGRFPVAVGDRHQFLAAISTHADHHQQAQLGLLEADLEVDAVDPQVDVVGPGHIAAPERGGFVLPLRGQAGDRGGRQSGPRAEELLQCRPEVPAGQPMQIQQRQHLAHLRGLACPRGQDR